jgi:restriction system protein
MMEVGYGALRTFDPTDIAAPIEALRAHLMLRPDETLTLHPQRLEDVVGSIFGDFGYRARVTAYHGDGGIDAYLDGKDGLVGVQVKRTKNPIEIEQVNSLTGALLVNDCASGVFVTTSRFRRGAKNVASKARARDLPIELYDGSRFLQALEVAQLGASFDPEDIPGCTASSKSTTKTFDAVGSLRYQRKVHFSWGKFRDVIREGPYAKAAFHRRWGR